MKGLLGLKSINLTGSSHAAITGEDTVSMSELLQVKSLRHLCLERISFADDESSLTFSQAIAQSTLDRISVYGRTEEGSIPIDVTRTLNGSNLRRLELSNVTFLEYDWARALCRALAGSQVFSLEIFELAMHPDTIIALGKSICRPCLKHLDVRSSSDIMIDSIGKSLHCAPNLQVLRIDAYCPELSENTVVQVFGGCNHCPDLEELKLEASGIWTVAMDQAAADCTSKCSKLVTIDLGNLFDRGSVWTCPAFLAACQAHRVVEAIVPPFECRRLAAALALLTVKNKETRLHRSRFVSLAGDRHARVVFSRGLQKVNNKPHLIFVALTSNKHLF